MRQRIVISDGVVISDGLSSSKSGDIKLSQTDLQIILFGLEDHIDKLNAMAVGHSKLALREKAKVILETEELMGRIVSSFMSSMEIK